MVIHLIAVGDRMPRWVQQGYEEYAKRLPPECALKLVEISAGKRGKNADLARVMRGETERLSRRAPIRSRSRSTGDAGRPLSCRTDCRNGCSADRISRCWSADPTA